jgi:hypothetical protein
MERLAKLVGQWLELERGQEATMVASQLKKDYAGQVSPEKIPRQERKKMVEDQQAIQKKAAPERQARHMNLTA